MRVKIKRMAVAVLLGVAGLMIIGPTLSIHRVTPPFTGGVAAPANNIDTVLKRACYDCHSNATRWPWYSYIPPVSWLIARDVKLGRKELNFSEWGAYYPKTQVRKLQWINRTLHQENMPPWSYRLLHSQAALSQADLMLLEQWVESQLAARQSQQSSNATEEDPQ